GEDNCTPADQLVYSIRKSGTGTGFPVDANGNPIPGVTFTCAELGTQYVELWAKDKAGNASYCETYVIVQDPGGVNCAPGTKAAVAGDLKVDFNDPNSGVADVQVQLNGSNPNPGQPDINMFVNSNNQGSFNFNAIPIGGNYTVTPAKDNDPLNGVSTYDLLLISKHILGVEPLNTPYKMIAADANKSGSITSYDILELRKLILGLYTELPNNTSWRFVDRNQVLDATNPFASTINELAQIQNLTANQAANFYAVKVGDVNNNAVANNIQSADDRTAGTVFFDVEDRAVKAGEEVTVNFKSADKTAGFQFTMNLNGLEATEIVGSNVKAENFAVFAADKALTASVDGNANEFAVKFRATKDGDLSKMIGVSSRITRAEAYTANGDRYEVAFRFNGTNGSVVAGAGFELLQNTPNPVANTTAITFNLPEATNATLTITNAEGRIIKTMNADFAKGMNTVNINRADLESGILFYQLDTPTNSAVKKMIVVD
ncbi:MAG: T9SS type A sorting domain-containing protein, partial [Saprospiraceae bacterium]